VVYLNEFSDQLDVIPETSKKVKLDVTSVTTTQSDVNKYRSYLINTVYTDLFSSNRKRKTEGNLTVCTHHVDVYCCLSTEQMSTKNQYRVPT
jgi:hypothetical protein